MFRNPNGKALRHIFEHAAHHDLENYSPDEKGLLFLLMSIAGNSTSSESAYGFNGAMQIRFSDAPAAIAELQKRGYLAAQAPLEFIIESATVPELKAILKSHKLPVGGKRADIVARLETILSPEIDAQLRENHSYWWPSSLGFELLYALYLLWEKRQTDLLCAIADCDIRAIESAYQFMPNSAGFWNDESKPAPISEPTMRIIRSSPSASYAFQYICGFSPEFFISVAPEFGGSSQENERLNIMRAISNQHLERYRAYGNKKVRWICKDKNPECMARDHKVYWIDNAPPCPTDAHCRCRYVAVVELSGESSSVEEGQF